MIKIEIKEDEIKMNKIQRQEIFFVSIFVIIGVGTFLLKLTIFECLLLLNLSAIVMKLTDIEDTLEGKL